MASLDASAVSYYPEALTSATWSEPGVVPRRMKVQRLKLTSVSVGGATNTITASAVGFTKVVHCTNFLDTTNSKVIPAVVDPVNNVILLGAGSANAVADLSSVTGYITIWGE